MKKKRIKVIALLMSIFMLLSYSEVFAAQHYTNPESTAWSNTTYFKEGTTKDNAPTISWVYLEKGSNGKFTEAKAPESPAVGTTFYVGLKLSNFGRYKAMADGVGNIDIPIVYNFSYIALYAGSSYTTNEATINLANFKTNVTTDTQNASADSYLNKTFDKEFYGEYIPTPLYDLSIDALTAPSEVKAYMGETGLSGLVLSITPNTDASATDLTKTTNIIDTDYVMVAQVRVKKQPENGAALPVLSIAPSSTLTATIGSLGMTYGNGATPWDPYVILDDSGVDIFPAGKKTVSIKTQVGETETTLTDTIKVEETDTTVKFSDISSKLTAPTAPSGEYFAGWSKTADGTVLTANDTIDIAADKSVKVYAVFKDNVITGLKADTAAYSFTGTKVYGGDITVNSAATKVTVVYTNGDEKELTYDKFAANGIHLYHCTTATANGKTDGIGNALESTDKWNIDSAGKDYFTIALDSDKTKNTGKGEFSVNKKTLTLQFAATSTGSTNKVYDGNTTASGITPSYPASAKVKESDTLPAFGTINYTFADANVGTGKAIKAAFAGAAPNNDQYVLALPAAGATNVTGNITAKPIGITIANPTSLEYNGTNKTVTVSSSDVTLVASDYSVAYTKDGATANTQNDAGAYVATVTLLNGNYSTTSTLTSGYTVTPKALNPKDLVVKVSQNNAQSGDLTITDLAATYTQSDKLAADTVNVTVSGSIAEADIKAGGNGKTVKNPTYKVSNANYVIGTAAVTAEVTNLPVATALDATTQAKLATQTMTAADANNTEDYLITKLANLPTEGQSNIAGDAGKVKIAWTVDKAYIEKGTTYTYTGKVTAADPSKLTANISDVTVKVTVSAVEITAPDVTVTPTAQIGDTVTLPTSGTTTVNGVTYTVPIEWSPASVNTNAEGDVTVTGTFKYDDATVNPAIPGWVTIPDAAKTVTKKVTVSAIPTTDVEFKGTIAPVEVDANNKKNQPDDKLNELLPDKIKLVDGSGKEYDNVPVTWAIATGTYDIKGGEYTYTATPDATYLATNHLVFTGTAPTATVKVNTLSGTIDKDSVFAPVTVAKGTQAADHEALGLVKEGTITVGGETVKYTVTWTTDVSELDTSVAKNSKDFEGTIEFDPTTVKPWMTLPTGDDLKVTQTVSVPADVEATDFAADTKTALADVADKKILASDPANADLDGLAGLLPTDIKVVDKDGKEYDATLTWKLEDGKTHTPTGDVYNYTSTIISTDADATKLKAPTAKITVEPVKSKVADGIFDKLTVSKNRKNDTWADLGMPVDGKLTLDPEVANVEVEYEITWTPASTAFDTSKAGNTQDFAGTIKIKNEPAWLTLPTNLTGTKTLTVASDTVSSGRGSASRSITYAVTFSAGAHGTIVSGKRSVTVAKDKFVTELPEVKANDGYKFLGWSQDGGKTIINPEETPIIKATALTAVYEEIVEETPVPTDTPLFNPVYTKPYASGYDGDVFLPNNNITRAELATMIARLIYGDELPNSYRASFSDIASDAWYNKYVGYLEGYGILNGYEEDGEMVFKPEQTITRAEMATVITRAQRYAIDHSDSTFWDVANDYWAKDYITTLAGKGIITGYADGSFGATSPLTRAEAVVIINRLLDPSTAIVTFNPIDISGHWAEQEIILAVNERQVNGTGEEATPEPEETPAPEATAEPAADETAEPTATPAE